MKQNSTFGQEYKKIFHKGMEIIVKIVRQVYIAAFNIYAWVWLYRLIFVNDNSSFEEYLMWFFACVGMWFFVLDGSDKKLRDLYQWKENDSK
jgi:hypothetical protein